MTDKIEEKKLPIVMKSGLVHWVSPETHKRMQDQLATQSGHTFVKIAELGRVTINTSEVEGVYDLAQYEDVCRLKNGERQCRWRKWHGKKEECQCEREWHIRHQEALRRAKEASENKELTADEKEALSRKVRALGDEMRAAGVIGSTKNTTTKEGMAEYERLTGKKFGSKK